GYEFWDFDLYQAYLILEESSAEQIIKDFLIPNFVPELYSKLKTIAARGVDDLEVRVQDFSRLFVFIHTNPIYFKKAWVVADGDVAGLNCIKKIKEKFPTWPQEHFRNFSKENFECYYPKKFQGKVVEIFKISDRKKRGLEKSALLREVILWSFDNREEAIDEFGKSAKEIIDFLKTIKVKAKI